MHEFSLMASVLQVAEQSARQANAQRITRITLKIGALTEVLPDAMQFAHQALTPGTLAEGSDLVLNQIEARSRCLSCGLEYTPDRYRRYCPDCAALACELLAGRELEIESIEVENGD
ncbi:MAG: hydrogenase maturation nickel metallochaperone HypA [Coriobacteriales bacterium]|jgi:hydrogenase nickel incorporation protein HypA/HybF|nr:hydrogenase maturation nickel metallochaperone HypA [Coriobacteriales bacterium]